MERWFIKNKQGDYGKIEERFNVSRFISKLLVNRDILDFDHIESYLDPSLDKLVDPRKMKDLGLATSILKEDIHKGNKIRIVGDYDVDGVMSIYILLEGIKRCGGNVDYVIPHRVNDGYGINMSIIDGAKEDGIDTIITCDNGIGAFEPIKHANDLGIRVIITDHHDVPFVLEAGEKKYSLPDGDAVVNPKQEDCPYPFKSLCGAGIAYKVIEDLYDLFQIEKEEAISFIQYVAIASICDIVDLTWENRIFVKKGLDLLNQTDNIGLRALLNRAGIGDKTLGVYHVGFILGPNINASGRLDSASMALDLLLTNKEEEAEDLANTLVNLNEERKKMTQNGTNKVIERVISSNLIDDKVLVVYEPDINESIAGIIAGRVKEKFNKPTIVLTRGKEGIKGSGRSIEEYNMFEGLSQFKDLLTRFGGHPMAAGLSLEEENIGLLRDKLNQNTDLRDEDFIPKVYIDFGLPIDRISYDLVNELDILEPFGKGNSKPLFGDKGLKILRGQVLGKNQNTLKLNLLSSNNRELEGLYFGDISDFEKRVENIFGKEELNKLYKGIKNNISMDILYYPNINEFRGLKSLQVMIQNYRFT